MSRTMRLTVLGSAALILASIGTGFTAPAAVAVPACANAGVTSYPPPPATDTPFGITQGPGGTWYSEGGSINRIRGNGQLDQFPVPDPASADIGWLSWGGDSKVWFADRALGRLGSIDGSGRIVEYQVPDGPNGVGGPGGIVVAGATVWFTDPFNDRIGKLDVATGSIRLFTIPTAGGFPLGLAMGPDGALWFTERSAAKIGRVTTDGTFTEWPLAIGALPNRIVVGPDGALWFTELIAGRIGRITVQGALTETPIDGGPVGITLGGDGSLYVALFFSGQLARLATSGSVTTTWTVPGALQAASSQGAVWLTDPFSDTVSRVRVACAG